MGGPCDFVSLWLIVKSHGGPCDFVSLWLIVKSHGGPCDFVSLWLIVEYISECLWPRETPSLVQSYCMNAKFVRIEVLGFEMLLVWNGFDVV